MASTKYTGTVPISLAPPPGPPPTPAPPQPPPPIGAQGSSGGVARQTQRHREGTVTAADGIIPVIYGQQRLGGRIFYVNTHLGNLFIAMAFCEGPVHSFTAGNVMIDDTLLATCVSKGWISSYNLHTGGLSQTVDSLLSTAFGYTQTHPGLCYAVFKITGEAPWSNLPSFLAVIQGLEIYDPRGTPTTAYSRNPVLLGRDMLTRFAGQVTADFDDTSAGNAADYYDATIDSEPRYALDFAIVNQGSLRDWLQNLKAHVGLDIYMDQGVWCFAPDKVLSSPLALTDANLANVNISRKSADDTPTRITVSWTNVVKDYVSDSTTVETDAVAAGTEDPVEQVADCPGITSMKTAARHALYLLRRANFSNIIVTALVSPAAEQLVRGSLVAITSSPFLAAQEAIVRELRPKGDGSFDGTFEEFDSNAYSTATYTVDTPPSTDLPDPTATPPDLTDVTGVDSTAMTTNTPAEKIVTSYAGLTYRLPSYVFANRIRVRAFAGWDEGVRDAKTWDDMAASEVIVPLTGNLPPVDDITFALDLKAIVVGTDTFTYNSLGELTDELVSRAFSRIIVKTENIIGILSAGVTVDGAALESGGGIAPTGNPAIVKYLTLVAMPLPPVSLPTTAEVVLDGADRVVKISTAGSPFTPLVGAGAGAPDLQYLDLPDQVVGDPAIGWAKVVYGAGLFVACATTATNQVMTSPDGVTWTKRTLPTTSQWYALHWNGTIFVLVAMFETKALTSSDGITWTQHTCQPCPYGQAWIDATYAAGLFVAVGGSQNYFQTSPDGITWTQRTVPNSDAWMNVAYGGSIFVALSFGLSGHYLLTSTNGTSWTARTLPAPLRTIWVDLIYAAGLFVAVANRDTPGYRVMTSPDGINWTARATPADLLWQSVVHDGADFIAVSFDDGQAMTSPDGVAWTLRTGPGHACRSLAYGGGVIVALGNGWPSVDALISTSTDHGVTWTPQTGPGSGVTVAPADTLRLISVAGVLEGSYDGGAFARVGSAVSKLTSIGGSPTITGTINGTNTSFTTATAAGTVTLVIVDGLPDVDATWSSASLTTSIAPRQSVVALSWS